MENIETNSSRQSNEVPNFIHAIHLLDFSIHQWKVVHSRVPRPILHLWLSNKMSRLIASINFQLVFHVTEAILQRFIKILFDFITPFSSVEKYFFGCLFFRSFVSYQFISSTNEGVKCIWSHHLHFTWKLLLYYCWKLLCLVFVSEKMRFSSWLHRRNQHSSTFWTLWMWIHFSFVLFVVIMIERHERCHFDFLHCFSLLFSSTIVCAFPQKSLASDCVTMRENQNESPFEISKKYSIWFDFIIFDIIETRWWIDSVEKSNELRCQTFWLLVKYALDFN